MNLPNTVEELEKQVETLRSTDDHILHLEHAYNLYLNHENFFDFIDRNCLDLAILDFDLIYKQIDFSQFKFIKKAKFSTSVGYRQNNLRIDNSADYIIPEFFKNDEQNGKIYSITCFLNKDKFYIQKENIAYNQEHLHDLLLQQLKTHDKIFIERYNVMNILNTFYDHSMSDQTWLSFFDNKEHIKDFCIKAFHFFASQASLVEKEDDLYLYKYFQSSDPINVVDLAYATIDDIEIPDNILENFINEVFTYFYSSRLGLLGINNIATKTTIEYDLIDIDFIYQNTLYPYNKITRLSINDEKIKITLGEPGSGITILEPTSIHSENILQDIEQAALSVFNDMNNDYSSCHTDDEYRSLYEKNIKKCLYDSGWIPEFKDKQTLFQIIIDKESVWCNPPKVTFVFGSYQLTCHYDEWEKTISQNLKDINIHLDKHILKTKMKEPSEHRTNGHRI